MKLKITPLVILLKVLIAFQRVSNLKVSRSLWRDCDVPSFVWRMMSDSPFRRLFQSQ